MRRVDDPAFDSKALVAQGYDRCAESYAAARDTEVPPWLELVTEPLCQGAAVLDIGCGCGVPIARALTDRFAVVGVDISARQIELASQNVPAATFIHGDIMSRAFAPGSFDAVVMLYALFHLQRFEHAELLRRIRTWLRPGGLLLATLTRTSHAGYGEDDFFGAAMYWSHFAEHEYYPILEREGFTLLETRTIGHGYRDSLGAGAEVHGLILARGTYTDPP